MQNEIRGDESTHHCYIVCHYLIIVCLFVEISNSRFPSIKCSRLVYGEQIVDKKNEMLVPRTTEN